MSTLQHFEDNEEGTDNFFKMSQQVPFKNSKLLIATACASTFYVSLAAEYQLR